MIYTTGWAVIGERVLDSDGAALEIMRVDDSAMQQCYAIYPTQDAAIEAARSYALTHWHDYLSFRAVPFNLEEREWDDAPEPFVARVPAKVPSPPPPPRRNR